MRIAIDGHGGDLGNGMILEALRVLLDSNAEMCKEVEFTVFCRSAELFPGFKTVEIVDATDQQILYHIVKAVAEKKYDCCVSAGETGFYMLQAIKYSRRIVKRPVLVSSMPSLPRYKILLDMGANLTCTEVDLVRFAILGRCYAKIVGNIERPKVSFLNIGLEDSKGPIYIREALSRYNQCFATEQADFIEGDGLFEQDTDVVVMDGYTGNVLIKFAAGLSRFFFRNAKSIARNSPLYGLMAKPLFKKLYTQLNANEHNSAIMMGLEDLIIKAHGNSNVSAFVSTLKYAINACRCYDRLLVECKGELERLEGELM